MKPESFQFQHSHANHITCAGDKLIIVIYAPELGNYAEYSGAPKEDEVLQYARVVIDCATSNPDGQKRGLVIGGGIANFTDVAATFSGIIRALKEKEQKLKEAKMNIYARRGGPNYQKGLAKMRALGEENKTKSGFNGN